MPYIVDRTSLINSYEYLTDPSNDQAYTYNPQDKFRTDQKITGDDFNTLLKADQIAYGARFNTLVSLARDEGDTGNLRPIVVDNRDTDTDYWDMIVPPMLYTIPNPIPGSEGVTTTNSGTTLQTRGGLIVWTRGKDVVIQVRIQRLTLNGTGGIVLAGSPSIGQVTHGAAYSWEGTVDTVYGIAPFLLFPAGSAPGDLYRIIVSAKQDDPLLPGYVSAIMVHETPLQTTR